MPVKIGLDLHGVLIDAFEAKRRSLEKVTGLRIPPLTFAGKHVVSEGTRFTSADRSVVRTISRDEYAEAMRLLHETDLFFEFACPVTGALEGVRRLSSCGHEMQIVSGVKGLSEGRVWAWVRQHRLPICRVIATRKAPKTRYYNECDVVLDDEHDHLKPLAAHVLAILLLPAHGTTGSRRVHAPTGRLNVRAARGWAEALRHLN